MKLTRDRKGAASFAPPSSTRKQRNNSSTSRSSSRSEQQEDPSAAHPSSRSTAKKRPSDKQRQDESFRKRRKSVKGDGTESDSSSTQNTIVDAEAALMETKPKHTGDATESVTCMSEQQHSSSPDVSLSIQLHLGESRMTQVKAKYRSIGLAIKPAESTSQEAVDERTTSTHPFPNLRKTGFSPPPSPCWEHEYACFKCRRTLSMLNAEFAARTANEMRASRRTSSVKFDLNPIDINEKLGERLPPVDPMEVDNVFNARDPSPTTHFKNKLGIGEEEDPDRLLKSLPEMCPELAFLSLAVPYSLIRHSAWPDFRVFEKALAAKYSEAIRSLYMRAVAAGCIAPYGACSEDSDLEMRGCLDEARKIADKARHLLSIRVDDECRYITLVRVAAVKLTEAEAAKDAERVQQDGVSETLRQKILNRALIRGNSVHSGQLSGGHRL